MGLRSFLLKIIQIGCIGFGGGNALIPVIEQTLLKDSDTGERKAFDRDIIVANLTPGALPVEILSSVGRRGFGTAGMISGAFAFTMPGTVIVLLLLILFSGNQEAAVGYVKTSSVGISAFIICLLGEYVAKVIKRTAPQSSQRYKTILMVVLVFAFVSGKNLKKIFGFSATPMFGVSTAVILAAAFFSVFYVQSFKNTKRMAVGAFLCLLFFLCHGQAGLISDAKTLHIIEAAMIVLSIYGIADTLGGHKKWLPVDFRAMGRDLLFWCLMIIASAIPAAIAFPSLIGHIVAFVARGSLSSLMSFGGGDAYLAIAEGLFVDTGMISQDYFYGNIVTVVNVTPGSILCKTLSATGFQIGLDLSGSVAEGLLFALAGLGCSIAMSCMAFGVVYHLYDSLIELQMFMALSRWIRPIVGGLLINVGLSLVSQDIGIKDYVPISRSQILIFLVPLIAVNGLMRKRGVHDVIILLIDIALALIYTAILTH